MLHYLFWTESVGSIHEMSTDHREYNAESVLGWKLHTLFELVLKNLSIKAGKKNQSPSS